MNIIRLRDAILEVDNEELLSAALHYGGKSVEKAYLAKMEEIAALRLDLQLELILPKEELGDYVEAMIKAGRGLADANARKARRLILTKEQQNDPR